MATFGRVVVIHFPKESTAFSFAGARETSIDSNVTACESDRAAETDR